MRYLYLKKAIGPIISIILLLLVSISSLVFLSSWYSSFQSDFNSKVSVPQNQIEIKGLVGDFLFVRSYSQNNLTYKAIMVGNKDCTNSGILVANDYNKINISNCTKLVSNGVQPIVIVSKDGVFQQNLIVNNNYLDCSLNGTNLAHAQSYNFYNSSFVLTGNTCSNSSRTCSDGVFLGNSTFNISSCIVQDFIPNSFYFTNQTGVLLNTLTLSNTLIPTGYNQILNVNVTGTGSPQLSVNGGTFSINSTMSLGDTLQLRLTSFNTYSTDSIVNVSLGGFSSLWKIRTNFLCPTNYIFVNSSKLGSFGLTNYNFCVMKYEAKNVSGLPISQPANFPWGSINQTDARLECNLLGIKYHLITNSEWITIARLIENNSNNWVSGIIGVGRMYRGNINLGDSASCGSNIKLDGNTVGVNCLNGLRNKRSLNLSNDLIWDFSGNFWEWTNDTLPTVGSLNASLGMLSSNWYELTSIVGYSNLKPINSTFTALSNGIGKVYADNNSAWLSGDIHGFLRGGYWSSSSAAGVFSLYLNDAPSRYTPSRGFRCIYK